MKDYSIHDAAKEMFVFMDLNGINESYIRMMLNLAYEEGLADGKIELLKEQIAQVEVVTGGEK